jgi:hypothetical protein
MVDIYRVVIRLSLMAAELENQIGFISNLSSDEFRDVLDDAMTEAERLRRLANELLRVAMEKGEK